MAIEQEAIIHVLISLAVLLFAAKIFAEIFNKLKLPAVLGELIAGITVGPFALGSIPIFDGKPLVILDETVHQIGEIAGLVILFIAGLHITPREFLRGGASSFTIGALGVVVPFFLGYYVFTIFGLEGLQAIMIATALTATSIAISVSVFRRIG
jgi:Kef-type K+ transport system membrane component KefB